MSTRVSAWLAAAAATATVVLTVPFALAEDSITITRADEREGAGTIEFSVPARVVAGTDLAGAASLLENGAPLPSSISPLAADELEVVLVIDTSGSMREGGAIDAATAAAQQFVDSLPTSSAVGVVGFNDVVSLVSPLTTDHESAKRAIAALTARGETALYDALVFSDSVFSGTSTDQQILLLSDGGDTVSRNSFESALAVSTDVRTSVIELVSSESNSSTLQQLAAANGGTIGAADDPVALEALYADAAAVLENRYRLTFAPTIIGDVTYTVRLNSASGLFEATTTMSVAQLPVPTTVPTTTIPPTTTTTTTIVNVVNPNAGVPQSTSTESAPWLLAVGAGGVFCALLLISLIAFLGRTRERPSLRVSNLAVPDTGGRKDRAIERATGLADSLLEHGERGIGLSRRLDAAGMVVRPGEFIVIVALLGLAATLLLAVLLPFALGLVIGIVVTPLAATALLDNRASSRRIDFGNQLPDTLQLMSSTLRSGFGLPQALDSVSGQSAEPMKSELQRVLFESRIGRDLNEALLATADRMDSRDFRWVAGAIQINREVGGELAGVLDNVGSTIRGRQKLARQVQVLTAEGRYSAYVLIGLPFFLAGFLFFRQPEYFDPFRSGFGLVLAIGSVVLLVVGWLWMRALINKEY